MTAQRDSSTHLPEVMDRIIFAAADGSLRTGYVMGIRCSTYTGSRVLWVEPEQDFNGNFIPVALEDVIDSDARGAERRKQLDPDVWLRLLADEFANEEKMGRERNSSDGYSP
jgi:hypothetical protein